MEGFQGAVNSLKLSYLPEELQQLAVRSNVNAHSTPIRGEPLNWGGSAETKPADLQERIEALERSKQKD